MFEVATSTGLGVDTFTRNVTDGRTLGPQTDFDTKLIYPFFFKKARIIISNETHYIAIFHFSHYKSINILVVIAIKIAGQTFGF